MCYWRGDAFELTWFNCTLRPLHSHCSIGWVFAEYPLYLPQTDMLSAGLRMRLGVLSLLAPVEESLVWLIESSAFGSVCLSNHVLV